MLTYVNRDMRYYRGIYVLAKLDRYGEELSYAVLFSPPECIAFVYTPDEVIEAIDHHLDGDKP